MVFKEDYVIELVFVNMDEVMIKELGLELEMLIMLLKLDEILLEEGRKV